MTQDPAPAQPPSGNAAAQLVGKLRQRLSSINGRGFLYSFAAGVAARLGYLLLAIVVARAMGAQGYGVFTFATGVALLVAQFTGLGWPTLMNRLVPGFIKDRNWAGLKGLVVAGDAVVLGCSAVGSVLLFGIGQFTPKLETSFTLSAVLVVPFAIAILRRQQLAAFGRAAFGLMFDQGFGSLVTAGVILVVGLAVSAATSVWLLAVSTALGCVITTLLLRRLLPMETRGVKPVYAIGPWMQMAIPMIIGLSSKLLMNKTDILLLAPLSDLTQVGLYGAAFRITYLLTFPQVILMTVMTPLFSEAFTHNRPAQVRKLFRLSMIYALLTTAPVSLLLVLFSGFTMTTVFGPEFLAGAVCLGILAVGQLFAALTIPVASVLMMGGKERAFGRLNLSVLLLNAGLCFVFIPAYGATGAAMVTAICAFLLLCGQSLISRSLLKAAAPKRGSDVE